MNCQQDEVLGVGRRCARLTSAPTPGTGSSFDVIKSNDNEFVPLLTVRFRLKAPLKLATDSPSQGSVKVKFGLRAVKLILPVLSPSTLPEKLISPSRWHSVQVTETGGCLMRPSVAADSILLNYSLRRRINLSIVEV